MKILVTGAAGFIGTHVTRLLQERGSLRGRSIEALALLDLHPPETGDVLSIRGDISDLPTLDAVARFEPDVVFHLASVPGGAAEVQYQLGRRVNLDASLSLFEVLAAGGRRPTVVYASSIAVYGTQLPARVTPATPLRPPLTYGAHKLACEILLADFTRRGQLDARSVRLPGIVARARSSSGLTSTFMSDLLHALKDGEPFTCPVGPEATAWWMSVARCADNLVHAAEMDVIGADSARAWPLPVLRLSIREVMDTCAALFGSDRGALVRFGPKAEVEAVFGCYPELDDAQSRELGLRDDGNAGQLVARALGQIQ